MEEEQFCLRWTDFETNFQSSFQDLRRNNVLVDVTLACEDKEFEAHRVILSSSSVFFKTILQSNKHPHPWFYLRGIKHEDLAALLDFIYNGEVNISQSGLSNFLKLAEDLSIKGLTQSRTNPFPCKVKQSRSNSEEQMRIVKQTENEIEKNITKHNEIEKEIKPKYNEIEREHDSEFVRVKTEFEPSEEICIENTGSICVYDDSSDITANPLETYPDGEDHDDTDHNFDETYHGYGNTPMNEVNMECTEDMDLSSIIESMITRHQVEQKDGKFMTYLRCSICFRYYHVKHSTNLRNHIEAKHLIGDKYKCDHCDKQFKTNSAIRKHMSVTHSHVVLQQKSYNYTK